MSDRARRWGVQTEYEDTSGRLRTVPEATVAAVLAAMGADAEEPPSAAGLPRVVREGERIPLEGTAELLLEDGTSVSTQAELPAHLPLGYHRIALDGGDPAPLIVVPDRCHLPPGLRAWGWAAQLYAARSRSSWGVGDLGDLRRLADWSRGLGAGHLLINPLHAGPAAGPQEPSPYYPSSRTFRNPVYIAVEQVPGASVLGDRLDALARAGRSLNRSRLIDRDAVWALKREALEAVWAEAAPDPGFERHRSAAGSALETYATFAAISEVHGRGWRAWPAELRHPDGPGVAEFAARHAGRVRFHQWLQWLVDRQLEAAAREIAVIQDLAIGVDPDGADAWRWQDVFAGGVTVGAPPDQFNTGGQNWGLPPFDPWRLRSAGYGPFIETIRAGLRHAGGLRIDHVMGLFRLYWIPEGAEAVDGAYVRYAADDLLGIVALESVRAGAVVVGEDLGTVEPSVRDALERRRILSYRLLWFEPEDPPLWPELALGAVTTHDLPTVVGLWDGSDLERQRSLGLDPNEADTAAIVERLRRRTALPADAPPETVVEATYAHLAQAPSALLAATLDDLCLTAERPNMPGTTGDRSPNWSLALPATVEDLADLPLAGRLATALRREDRHRAPS